MPLDHARASQYRHRASIAFVGLLVAAGPALAAPLDTTAWLAPADGSFLDRTLWDNGVPTPNVVALFGVTADPTSFNVTLESPLSIGGLTVANQSPMLKLLGNTLTIQGSVLVSAVDGESASLTARGGTWKPSGETIVGSGIGSAGALTLGPGLEEPFGSPLRVGTNGGDGVLVITGTGTSVSGSLKLGVTPSQPDLIGHGRVIVSDHATFTPTSIAFAPPHPVLGRSSLAVAGVGSSIWIHSGVSLTGPITLEAGEGAAIGTQALSLEAGDRIALAIGPNGTGMLNNAGILTRAGELAVTFAPGFVPPPGSIYPLVSSTMLTGAFDAITVPNVGGSALSIVTIGTTMLAVVPTFQAELVVEPGSVSTPAGYSVSLSISLAFPDGTHLPVTSGLTWQFDDPTIATYAGGTSIIGLLPGTTVVHITSGSSSVDLPIEVTPTPTNPAVQRSSETAGGVGANGDPPPGSNPGENFPAISGDGRFVAFASLASNLVPNDLNNASDVFVKDHLTGAIERVSVSSSGAEAMGASVLPEISRDGRYVVFLSNAANLANVSGSANRVYRHDRLTGETRLVVTSSDDVSNNGSCTYSAISSDGRYVAFVGNAGSLLSEPLSTGIAAFRKDMETGELTLVSRTSDGSPAQAAGFIGISGDGASIVFSSDDALLPGAPHTLQAYLANLADGTIVGASRRSDGTWANGTCVTARIDRLGRRVAFLSTATNLLATPTTGPRDAFVFDRIDGSIVQANTSSSGEEASSTIGSVDLSGNGRYVTFRSASLNLTSLPITSEQTFRKDLLTGDVTLVSLGPVGPANGSCAHGSSISDDGGQVAFGSEATNLAPFDSTTNVDIFRGAAPAAVAGDVDGDGVVGSADLATLLGDWGSASYASDLNGDGVVEAADLALLLGAWSTR